MFRSSGEANFDKLLDRATSHLLLEVDLGAVLGITDLIRQKDCTPKYAVSAIKKKLTTPNPHVAFYSLQVLEAVVKNCGSPSHEEVATKEFMEFLRDLAKTTNHDNVRDKILELIQTWAHAFRKLSSYRAVQDCVNIMKAEGCKFPPLVEADAMFMASTAPEWQEGECCNRCRVQFGLLNRKHHCRACGQIFCAKCSSKVSAVPKFGIEKEVRVCDSCFEKYGNSSGDSFPRDNDSIDDPMDMLLRGGRPTSSQPPSHSVNSKSSPVQHSQAQQPRGKTEAELKEEEDLALALAISQSEAEEKEREKQRKSTGGSASAATSAPTADRDFEKSEKDRSSSTPKKSAMAKSTFEQEDPELARYLDRNYWEQRHGQTKEEVSREETGSSLHNKSPSPFQPSAPVKENKNKVEQVEEMDGFMESLRASIEMFVNRMRSNSNRGRHVSNDSTVQSLFLNITSLHSQLLNYIKAQDDWRAHYESLQEKLMQVHDARDALDDLRKDYGEKQRRIAEEIERQRQIQRQIKLQDMRQQKHQYLQQQRDLALRRIQEEERQMQLRMEQQRLGTFGGYSMRGQGYAGPPSGQIPPGMMMGPGQGQDPQHMYQYMPQAHYMDGQQHPNAMLPPQHHIPQGQGPQHIPAGQGYPQHMAQGQGYQQQHIPPGQGYPQHIPQAQGQQQHIPPGQGQQQHIPQSQGQQQQIPPGQGQQQYIPPGQGQQQQQHIPPGQGQQHIPPGQGQQQHIPPGQGYPQHMPPGQGYQQHPYTGPDAASMPSGPPQMMPQMAQGPPQVEAPPQVNVPPQPQVNAPPAQVNAAPSQANVPPQAQVTSSQPQVNAPPPQIDAPPQVNAPPTPVGSNQDVATAAAVTAPAPAPPVKAEPDIAELISFD